MKKKMKKKKRKTEETVPKEFLMTVGVCFQVQRIMETPFRRSLRILIIAQGFPKMKIQETNKIRGSCKSSTFFNT